MQAVPHKLKCPSCETEGKYKRYLNTETNAFDLPYEVGRCDREDNCGYHVKPREHFESGGNVLANAERIERPKSTLPPSFTDFALVNDVIATKTPNNFTFFLVSMFGQRITSDLIERFHIGTSRYWNGACVFWQISDELNVHAGKIMSYETTGRRKRDPDRDYVTWVHSAMKNKDYVLRQCLFGLHQLTTEEKPVAIVESEKTAILMSVIYPKFTWLATGGKNGAKFHNCEALKDLNVVLLPDLGAEDAWHEYAKLARKNGINAVVKDWCKNPTDEQIKRGLDVADFITQNDVAAAIKEDFENWKGKRLAEMWQYVAKRVERNLTEAEISAIWKDTEIFDEITVAQDFNPALRTATQNILNICLAKTAPTDLNAINANIKSLLFHSPKLAS